MDAADDVGPRQHEHVAVALEIVRMRRRTARRGSRLPPACARWIIVPIAPSRIRMRWTADRRAVRCSVHRSQFSIRFVHVSDARFVPAAISTVNGSPVAPRADADDGLREAGVAQERRRSALVAEAEPAIAELRLAPRPPRARAGRAPARGRRAAGCGALRPARARDARRDGAPATAARRRSTRRRSARCSRSPRFQVMFAQLAARGELRGRAPARPSIDRRR